MTASPALIHGGSRNKLRGPKTHVPTANTPTVDSWWNLIRAEDHNPEPSLASEGIVLMLGRAPYASCDEGDGANLQVLSGTLHIWELDMTKSEVGEMARCGLLSKELESSSECCRFDSKSL